MLSLSRLEKKEKEKKEKMEKLLHMDGMDGRTDQPTVVQAVLADLKTYCGDVHRNRVFKEYHYMLVVFLTYFK